MLSLEDQAKIIEVLLPYEPEYIGVFGSVACGEDGPESDVDILTDRSLKPHVKPNVLLEMKLIYDHR